MSVKIDADQGIDNDDLFITQQFKRLNTTWELSIDGLTIVGLLPKISFEFGITNNFTGNRLSETFNNVDSAVFSNLRHYGPGVKAATTVGKALAKDLASLGVSNKLAPGKLIEEFGKGIDKVGDEVAPFKKKAVDWLKEGKSETLKLMGSGGAADYLSNLSPERLMSTRFISTVDKLQTYEGTEISTPIDGLTLETFCFHKKGQKGNVKNFIDRCIDKTSGKTYTNPGAMFALQTAPNEYVPDLFSMEKMSSGEGSKGTWKLRLGYLNISNILVTDFNFDLNMSRSIESWSVTDSKATPTVVGDPYMAKLTFKITCANQITEKDLKKLLNQIS